MPPETRSQTRPSARRGSTASTERRCCSAGTLGTATERATSWRLTQPTAGTPTRCSSPTRRRKASSPPTTPVSPCTHAGLLPAAAFPAFQPTAALGRGREAVPQAGVGQSETSIQGSRWSVLRACAELRQALNREQEAQGLLREQSAQLRTLTAQLHTHTADTTRTQHTLSQAAQEVRRKEQSLRILGKRLSAAQREKRESEDRLRQMEDSLTNTHRSKKSLVNFMTTVENTYKEVRDGLVQSRCSVTGKPLPLQLPRVHAELSGTERMMGGVEVTACERLVSTFADLYQAAGSRIGWLELEVSAQRGHVTALRSELQDACLRDNLAYIPVAEFSPLADPKACHRSPLSDLSKELPISRSSAQPCPDPSASS